MINKGLFSSNTPEWATPQDFFDALDAEFHFTLDPCSTDENAKCQKHYTKEQDGLSQDWTGEIVYCNPPYGREMPKWIKKCYEHYRGGRYGSNAYPGENGHKSLSRIHLWQSGNTLHSWAFAVWWMQEYCTFSEYGSDL